MTMELFLFCIVLTLYRRHNFNLTWLYKCISNKVGVLQGTGYWLLLASTSMPIPWLFDGIQVVHFFLKFSLLRFSFFLSAFCISCPFDLVSLDCQFMIAASVFSNIYFQLCSNFFIRRSNLSTRTWQNDVVVEYSNGWLYMILTQA
jgi:hypothetical protein